MEDLLKMDIFFIVTTAVVVLAGILLVFLLYYAVHILRDIREITRLVRDESKAFVHDLTAVRTDIKEGVHTVRENVEQGSAKVKTYSEAVAGAGIIKAVSSFMEGLAEEKTASKKRRTRKKTTKKTTKKKTDT